MQRPSNALAFVEQRLANAFPTVSQRYGNATQQACVDTCLERLGSLNGVQKNAAIPKLVGSREREFLVLRKQWLPRARMNERARAVERVLVSCYTIYALAPLKFGTIFQPVPLHYIDSHPGEEQL